MCLWDPDADHEKEIGGSEVISSTIVYCQLTTTTARNYPHYKDTPFLVLAFRPYKTDDK